MSYRARIKWRGVNHPVQNHVHAKLSMKFPATAQVYDRLGGHKITAQYDNAKLTDLAKLNSWYGFWVVRRIGGVMFNQMGNQKWAKKWTKLFGVQARIPYPLPKGDKAVAQVVLCDSNTVYVNKENGKWCRIDPVVARLTEVEIGTGRMFLGGLRWRVYPDKKSDEIWIEKSMLEKI